MGFLRKIGIGIFICLGFWILIEVGMRLVLEAPLEHTFYGSIPHHLIPTHQEANGVKVSKGQGWVHLGWIADPAGERYRIERREDGKWEVVGETKYGSYLYRGEGGRFRVWAEPLEPRVDRLIGEVEGYSDRGQPLLAVPKIAGNWKTLFKPQEYGYYINDHTLYQDCEGDWRLLGITDTSEGDYNAERYFAFAHSELLPPQNGMTELAPVADFGELAWAPHVIKDECEYHMFWSPHRLHRMVSKDGIEWQAHQVVMEAPYHYFFRDPMVLEVADGQWLLYTTARGTYFSRIDVYQSFDLEHWQYIGPALKSGLGSERNSPFASMESPFVVNYKNRFYLTLTYNNDSFFWPGILMSFKIWLNPDSYNETLVFHADNPYDFGEYRGKGRTGNYLTTIEAHAPELVHDPLADRWFITTAGWPWVATLTDGEVAIAPLEWMPAP